MRASFGPWHAHLLFLGFEVGLGSASECEFAGLAVMVTAVGLIGSLWQRGRLRWIVRRRLRVGCELLLECLLGTGNTNMPCAGLLWLLLVEILGDLGFGDVSRPLTTPDHSDFGVADCDGESRGFWSVSLTLDSS